MPSVVKYSRETKNKPHSSVTGFRHAARALRALFHKNVTLPPIPAKSYENLRQRLFEEDSSNHANASSQSRLKPKQFVVSGRESLQTNVDLDYYRDSPTAPSQETYQTKICSRHPVPLLNGGVCGLLTDSPRTSCHLSQELYVGDAVSPTICLELGNPSNISNFIVQAGIAAIISARLSMPLRTFLQWINENYGIDELLPQQSTAMRYEAPSDDNQYTYEWLQSMMDAYNPKRTIIRNRDTHKIINVIYKQLESLHESVGNQLKEIEETWSALPLREFVSWAYAEYKNPHPVKLLRRRIPWNPEIISSAMVIREAIAYYEQEGFLLDEGHLCICAKHIVCLLKGGRDWREKRGDRFVVHHSTPAALRAVFSSRSLRW